MLEPTTVAKCVCPPLAWSILIIYLPIMPPSLWVALQPRRMPWESYFVEHQIRFFCQVSSYAIDLHMRINDVLPPCLGNYGTPIRSSLDNHRYAHFSGCWSYLTLAMKVSYSTCEAFMLMSHSSSFYAAKFVNPAFGFSFQCCPDWFQL